jgi:DNA-directed RNA polymerase specialized sigma24 family protein
VAEGRFPQLNDRHDFWKVLATITSRKATAQRRREGRQKRGGGRVRGESAFIKPGGLDQNAGIEGVLADEPTPAFAAQVADECRHLLDDLADESIRTIAVWKMEGYTNTEIADKLGCAPRTVERKLERIRAKWVQEEEVR